MEPMERYRNAIKTHLTCALSHLDNMSESSQAVLTGKSLATFSRWSGYLNLKGLKRSDSPLVLAVLMTQEAIRLVEAGEMDEATKLVNDLADFVLVAQYNFGRQLKAAVLIAKNELTPGSVGPDANRPRVA